LTLYKLDKAVTGEALDDRDFQLRLVKRAETRQNKSKIGGCLGNAGS